MGKRQHYQDDIWQDEMVLKFVAIDFYVVKPMSRSFSPFRSNAMISRKKRWSFGARWWQQLRHHASKYDNERTDWLQSGNLWTVRYEIRSGWTPEMKGYNVLYCLWRGGSRTFPFQHKSVSIFPRGKSILSQVHYNFRYKSEFWKGGILDVFLRAEKRNFHNKMNSETKTFLLN